MIFQDNITIFAGLFFAVAFPVGLMAWWRKKTGYGLWPFIVGAICFGLFAMVLENMLHQACLVNDNRVSRAILGSPVLYTLYGAFAAGIFEETGRLFGYKVLLRKHYKDSCAVAYGMGHGGCEIFIILGVNYTVLLLAQLGVDFGGEAVNAQLIATAEGLSFAPVAVGMLERIFAMMIHVGLSMLVFGAARDKRQFWLYPVAILLHALADVPAALYQYQVLTSVLVVEVAAFAMGVFCLVLGCRLFKERTKPVSMEKESMVI